MCCTIPKEGGREVGGEFVAICKSFVTCFLRFFFSFCLFVSPSSFSFSVLFFFSAEPDRSFVVTTLGNVTGCW